MIPHYTCALVRAERKKNERWMGGKLENVGEGHCKGTRGKEGEKRPASEAKRAEGVIRAQLGPLPMERSQE